MYTINSLIPRNNQHTLVKKIFFKDKLWDILNIFKTMSSSQPLLNLSKYESEDQEIYFVDITNSAFFVLQIMHAGIIVLSEIIYCAVKWFKFTSEIFTLIYI